VLAKKTWWVLAEHRRIWRECFSDGAIAYICLENVFSYFFVNRIDGKTIKSEPTLDETEVCIKETSSVTKVNPSLYQKLLTEDLTSVGKYLQTF